MGSQRSTLEGQGVGGRFNWLVGGPLAGLVSLFTAMERWVRESEAPFEESDARC